MIDELLRTLHRATGWRPTWPLDIRVNVGDVVVRSPTGLSHVTTLSRLATRELPDLNSDDLQVVFEAPREETESIEIANGVSVRMELATDAGAARAKFSFEASGSHLLFIRGGEVRRYHDQLMVNAALEALARAGKWEPEWELISSVRTARRSVLLASMGAGSVASANLDQFDASGIGGIMSILPLLRSGVTWERGAALGIGVVSADSAPLHQAHRVKRWPLRSVTSSGGPVRSTDDQSAEAWEVEPALPYEGVTLPQVPSALSSGDHDPSIGRS